MLFSSFEFIFLYLPTTLAVFFLLNSHSRRLGILWMGVASLFFYAWWQPSSLAILGASTFFNYLTGEAILKSRDEGRTGRAGRLLAIGVALNLAFLLYYKYTNFILDALNAATGWTIPNAPIDLPLGISFFTFTQTAYLADCRYKTVKRYGLSNYVLFVSYFPHLIAGPILHHGEMMPQFNYRKPHTFNAIDLSVGLTLFAMGLFKKAVVADNIAFMANAAFKDTAGKDVIWFYAAWKGSLAYTLQLYFDFSGYSDMAIGLSRMAGIKLPINFHSPYKACSPVDFWQRWHRTLSRFIRDYLYIPLGGSRKGLARKYLNLTVTMFLAGVWHGAGWTFILWGLMHAGYLLVNHLLRDAATALGLRTTSRFAPLSLFCALVTFLAVNFAWVMFRAETVSSGLTMIRSMLNFKDAHSYNFLKYSDCVHFGVLGLLLAVVFFMPNTQQIMRRYSPAIGLYSGDRHFLFKSLVWQPGIFWTAATSIVLCITVLKVLTAYKSLEFLYFQF